jgi:hypothetical protein
MKYHAVDDIMELYVYMHPVWHSKRYLFRLSPFCLLSRRSTNFDRHTHEHYYKVNSRPPVREQQDIHMPTGISGLYT